MPCDAYPAPIVDAWANMTTDAVYIRSVHAAMSGPMGLRSDTGVNVRLFHDPRYGDPVVPLYHESVDWYAEPDGPMGLPSYEFAPDYLIVRYGEYLQLEVGCVLQPGNTASPAWLDVTVTVFYVTERPDVGVDLSWGWLDTTPMILACGGPVVSKEWTNTVGRPVRLRLLHAWPGISGGARVVAKATVTAIRETREAQTIRPTWHGETPVQARDPILKLTWNRYAEPGNRHSWVVSFRDDAVTLLPGERLVFEASCKGSGFHQQNLLFFYGIG